MGFYDGDSACRECVPPKRHPGCHGQCEEYAAWKAKVEEKKKQYLENSKTDHQMMSIEQKRYKRIKKRKGAK